MKALLRTLLPRPGEPGYRPYRVKNSPLTRAEIIANCKAASSELVSLGLTTNFQSYISLVDYLRRSPRVLVKRLARFSEEPVVDRVLVGLRHDVDDDIWTALRCARHLASVGVPGSFFFLHTSHYYGRFSKWSFFRHRGLSALLREFVVTGCETVRPPLDILHDT